MAERAAKRKPVSGRVANGCVVVAGGVPWPDGTEVLIEPLERERPMPSAMGHVIVAGFGLAGRCVAELLTEEGIAFTIVERNPATIETQRALGRRVVLGDVTIKETLINANLQDAAALALTIPDEDAVLRATSLARQLNPGVYIIARTNYSSKGLQASQLGADDVVKAEQAVAQRFRSLISERIRR